MRHSNKERDNVAESRPGSNTVLVADTSFKTDCHNLLCKLLCKPNGERKFDSPFSDNVVELVFGFVPSNPLGISRFSFCDSLLQFLDKHLCRDRSRHWTGFVQ